MSGAKRRVQLESTELEDVRGMMKSVHDTLAKVGHLVKSKVEADSTANHPIKIVTMNIVTKRTIMDDGQGGCYVYEDPPGVCRGCDGSSYGEGG